MEEKKLKNTKKNIRPLLILGASVLFFLVLFLFLNRKTDHPGLKNGFVTLEGKSSMLIQDLFFIDTKDQTYINLSKLEECINLDVIRSKEKYILSTIKNQITIISDKNKYFINSNKIVDDDSYLMPIKIQSYIYADCNRIFELLGYDVSYKFNTNKTTIEATLIKTDDFDSNLMSSLKVDTIKDTIIQTTEPVEDKLVENTESMEATVEIPSLVPEVTEVDRENLVQETVNYIPVDSTNENEEMIPEIPSEEEFKEKRWEEKKEELSDIFKNSPSNFEQDAFAQIGDYGICYNQGSKGTYGNTVTIINDTYDGYYMMATFSADWTDQAVNVVTPQSKAYYSGLADVYKKTLVSLLGEIEGTAFFDYLKTHADEMQQGGYISQYDEKGVIRAIWSDDLVGDGLQASTLDLEPWIGRKTDDGLRYDIVREGDGVRVIVF